MSVACLCTNQLWNNEPLLRWAAQWVTHGECNCVFVTVTALQEWSERCDKVFPAPRSDSQSFLCGKNISLADLPIYFHNCYVCFYLSFLSFFTGDTKYINLKNPQVTSAYSCFSPTNFLWSLQNNTWSIRSQMLNAEGFGKCLDSPDNVDSTPN